MFKAILLDLDATLLNIDMELFLTQYFKKMTQMAKEFGIKHYDKLSRQVWQSTEVMIADLDPHTTNEEAFMQHFLNSVWFCEENQMREFFDFFYEKGFPQLQEYCQPFQGIPEMVEKLTKKHRVVIATNAVFPLKALQYRINWANLGHLDFDLITSYETMHFCKPHVQYYQEIADRIGVHPKDCLMVGNDMGEDLVAQELGMKTFLVEDMVIKKEVPYIPDWRGRLPDLYAFVDQIDRGQNT
jgi:FMN phosphatase YigB (HAD superfamily)